MLNYILAEITPHCLNSNKVVVRCTLNGALAYITTKATAKEVAKEANREWVEMLEAGSVEQLKYICRANNIDFAPAWNKAALLDRIKDVTFSRYPSLD